MPKKNNPYVKIANEVSEYTPEQIEELLKCSEDAVYCIKKYFHIQHPVKGSVPFALHPYQEEIIRRAQHNYYNIITIARQGGKCLEGSTMIEVIDTANLNWFQLTLLKITTDSNILKCFIPFITISIKELLTNGESCQIKQNGQLKFIEQQHLATIKVNTPVGVVPINKILKTVDYYVYELILESGDVLSCADEHLVLTKNGDVQVQHLTNNDFVLTRNGFKRVLSVTKTDVKVPMYDLELSGNYHHYYTNNIVSHNTTTIGAFLLWYAMFHEDQTVLVVSNKGDNAKEVIERIKFMYESCPLWLKPGVTEDGYNKHSLRFDNKSRIISQATSENSGRGLSISLLFCYGGDNTVELKDENGVEFTMTLEELYEYLGTE